MIVVCNICKVKICAPINTLSVLCPCCLTITDIPEQFLPPVSFIDIDGNDLRNKKNMYVSLPVPLKRKSEKDKEEEEALKKKRKRKSERWRSDDASWKIRSEKSYYGCMTKTCKIKITIIILPVMRCLLKYRRRRKLQEEEVCQRKG
ncbi:hypothetical protein AGDE_16049 [Angomonas deanei]|uniref:Uncharacterized protein n=1 Tax=Angomonas deanei TaxID=59799 RepID=A0A7G2CHS0_9TRYP|nr:hypothetical protein AGDE_16049 [Angomonas deanei]CAD2219296.1 hypothetical protein, conserved [Angomonas deanei]|eukprot:EPY17824.1 hypothetical protein AGDE_16049 [Angomonas deanei]